MKNVLFLCPALIGGKMIQSNDATRVVAVGSIPEAISALETEVFHLIAVCFFGKDETWEDNFSRFCRNAKRMEGSTIVAFTSSTRYQERLRGCRVAAKEEFGTLAHWLKNGVPNQPSRWLD